MRRRIGAVLTAVALMLSLLSTAALAAETTLTVKTPETIPKAGEEFTVTVDISGNPGFNSALFTLAFDRSDMSCIDAKASKLLDNTLNDTNTEAPEGAIFAMASLDAVLGDGILMVFTFKANRDLSDFGLALTNVDFTDEEGGGFEVGVDAAFSAESKPKDTTTPVTPISQTSPDTQSGETTETAAPAFPDAVKHWGEAWIVTAAERGLFSGDDKGFFRPDDNISRGDFVLVLWRMAGKPEPKASAPFADVPENAYYAKAVAWASEQGYVNGKGSGFAPKDSLTRQEAMKILFGYAGGVSGMEAMFGSAYDTTYNDSGEIASWAKPAMYWAVYNKIINGMNGGLNPKGTATRAQLAKILVEYQNEIESKNSD